LNLVSPSREPGGAEEGIRMRMKRVHSDD